MKTTVKLPKVGDGGDEVEVVEWGVSAGDKIVAGDALLQVETEKAVVEVPCPVAGIVIEILVRVGDAISTGHPIAVLNT